MTAQQLDTLRTDAERLIALNDTLLTATDQRERVTARHSRNLLLGRYAATGDLTALTDEAERLLQHR